MASILRQQCTANGAAQVCSSNFNQARDYIIFLTSKASPGAKDTGHEVHPSHSEISAVVVMDFLPRLLSAQSLFAC